MEIDSFSGSLHMSKLFLNLIDFITFRISKKRSLMLNKNLKLHKGMFSSQIYVNYQSLKSETRPQSWYISREYM